MFISYFSLLLFTCILGSMTNYLRYQVNFSLNKWILTISSILLMVINSFWINPTSQINMILFILVTAYCFKLTGGIVASLLGWGFYSIQVWEFNGLLLLGFLLLGICIGIISIYFEQKNKEEDEWTAITIRNSKQLNVLREVSSAIQNTYELEKILQIITTSVTAGHGLGFNRSMILLMDENETKLTGAIGVGPMNAEEGYKNWENITRNKYRLVDLIELQEKDTFLDLKLNEYVKSLEIDLDDQYIFSRVLKDATPVHIRSIDMNDKDQQLLSTMFNMEEFVVFPLINHGTKIGVLVIDNLVNKKAITNNEIDSVIPIAHQAAIAIEQANLYAKIEDMALKDELTGLMNHRAFQKTLHRFLEDGGQKELAMIMIDIDSFKHFNDTNGHLLGNHVLFQVANMIKNSIREADQSFRFGGEEFVVLLPDTNIATASKIAERIRRNVKNAAFPNETYQPLGCLTISLGVASSYQLTTKSGDHLIHKADQALYSAKDLGRDRVIIYGEVDRHA